MLVRRTLEAMTPISRDTWLFVLSLVWLVVLLVSASGEFKGLQAVQIIQTPSAAEMTLRATTPVNQMLALSMITS